jgi:hypothetical protein
MRRGKGKGHYKVFLPLPYVELSVCRSQGIDDAAVQALGMEHVGPPIKGHATVLASAVIACQLTFHADGEPYPRHASIVGWSGDEARDRVHAMALADASTLCEYEER